MLQAHTSSPRFLSQLLGPACLVWQQQQLRGPFCYYSCFLQLLFTVPFSAACCLLPVLLYSYNYKNGNVMKKRNKKRKEQATVEKIGSRKIDAPCT